MGTLRFAHPTSTDYLGYGVHPPLVKVILPAGLFFRPGGERIAFFRLLAVFVFGEDLFESESSPNRYKITG